MTGVHDHPWQPPLPIDILALGVLDLLGDGQTHDRFRLATQVGASVRQVRATVADLRQLGWPVTYGQNGGYRLSWDDADLDALERKYQRQALSQLRTLNRIRRARRTRAATMFDTPA